MFYLIFVFLTFWFNQASGPMLCYVNGELVAAEEANHSNVMHVHQKCFDWYCSLQMVSLFSLTFVEE